MVKSGTLSIYIICFLSGTKGLPTVTDINGTHTTTHPATNSIESMEELEHDVHNSTYPPNQSAEDVHEVNGTPDQSMNDFDSHSPSQSEHAEGFSGSTMPANESKRYLVIDDMVIKKDSSRAGVVNLAWPGGMVPYAFHISIGPQQQLQIAQAMRDISSVTCVKFRPAKNDDTYSLLYQSDPRSQGCSSYVGFQNRKQQPIQLAPVCSQGNVVHEIIHALGFYHEQTRNDRDEYVKINYENIQPGYENNFRKDKDMAASETEYYSVAYNYDSIMHYGKMFFSKNNQPTIETLNNTNAMGNGEKIGQRDGMSSGDITMINTKYNCPMMTTGTPIDQGYSPTSSATSEPDTDATEDSSYGPTTTKPGSNGNPMCQYNPTLPGCRVNNKSIK